MALDEAIKTWTRPERAPSRRLAAIASDGRPFVAALVVAMVLYVALNLWLTRGTTLFIDEVKLFMNNRGLDPGTLLAPVNGHLILVRTLFYAVGFKLFGAQTSFVLGRLVEAASVVVLAGLVFVFCRRRIGPAAALPAALLVLFLGSCWEINYSISGIDDVWALASGVGALLLLERPTERADVAVCALLTVSVASFTTGTAFLVGSFCLLALRHELRRRVWVVLVPLGLYVAWLFWVRLVYIPAHGNTQQFSLTNLLLFPNMVAQLASGVAGALAGLNYNFTATDPFHVFSTTSPYGPLLAAGAVAALVWRLQRVRSPMVWALLVALLTYWLELTVSTSGNRDPTVVRYVFFGGVVALLLVAELVRTRVTSPAILLVVYAALGLALLGNVARLREGMQFYRTFGTAMRAQMAGIELARPSVAPGFTTTLGSPPFPFFTISAGAYLRAVDRNGSPAYSGQQLLQQTETLRHITDSVLVAALRIGVVPQPAGAPVGRCVRHAGVPSGPPLTVFARPPGVSLKSATGAGLSMSQFGTFSTVAVGSLLQNRAVELPVPPDRSSRPWRVVIAPAPAEVTICQLQ